MTLNGAELVALIGAAVALATGAATFLAARRRSSGTVATSDASTLWAASEQIRKELRAEVVELRAQALILLQRIERLQKRLQELGEEEPAS